MVTRSIVTGRTINLDSPVPGYRGLLLAIIVLGIIARLLHFHTTIGSDDQRWVFAARQLFGEEGIRLPDAYYARILWRAILGLWGAPWGLTLETSAVLMFALSCLTILAVGYGARAAAGPRAGLLAALIYATHPLAIIYDPVTLSDGLGVTLVSFSIVLFFVYLRGHVKSCLLLAGLLVGLSISVKEYFVLLGLPFGLAILLDRRPFAERAFDLLALGATVAIGISVDFALHAWESGSPLAHWRASASYGDRLLSFNLYEGYTGWRLVAVMALDRLFYLRTLTVNFGAVAGLFTVVAAIFLVSRTRRQHLQWMTVSGAIAVFLLFLSFMPISLRPLAFVETQDRYLTIVLPFLSIASGAAIALALEQISTRGLRKTVLGLVLLGSVYNILLPNNMMDRDRLLEFVGIREAVTSLAQEGVTDVVLPDTYQQLVPDSFYSHGVSLTFLPFHEANAFQSVRAHLSSGLNRAIFVSRLPLRSLQPRLLRGDYDCSVKVAPHRQLVEWLQAQGFRKREVYVPYTSLRSWASILGIETKGQLVGWIYLR